jgi:hypothetical protein
MKKTEAREQYNDYLKSEKWRELASAVKQDRGNCCEFCQKPAAEAILHCHHMTYERFGRENKEDLLVLCELHHSRYHEWYPGRRMPKMPVDQLRPHVFEVLRRYENREKLLGKTKKKTKAQKAAEWEYEEEKRRHKALLRKADGRISKPKDHSAALDDLKRRQRSFVPCGHQGQQIKTQSKKKKQKQALAAEGYERTPIMLRRARRIARAMERIKKGCASPKEERRANRNHSKLTREWLDRVLAGEFGDSFDV